MVSILYRLKPLYGEAEGDAKITKQIMISRHHPR